MLTSDWLKVSRVTLEIVYIWGRLTATAAWLIGKKRRLANSSSCCHLTTCKFFKLCITNTWKCINSIRVRPQYWYKKKCRVRGPFFRKETLASASLYILATTMQTDKTSLAREQKIGFAKQRPPTYAKKWALIKLSKYKPSHPLSFSPWLTRISLSLSPRHETRRERFRTQLLTPPLLCTRIVTISILMRFIWHNKSVLQPSWPFLLLLQKPHYRRKLSEMYRWGRIVPLAHILQARCRYKLPNTSQLHIRHVVWLPCDHPRGS